MKMNPIIPMVAISSSVSEGDIAVTLRKYADAGIKQFMFYERGATADNIEYMSAEWLAVCGYIIKHAALNGLKVWLYDEFDCPSGTCHFTVMKENEEFYAKYIEVRDGVCTEKRYERYADILNGDAVDAFIRKTHEVYYSHFKEYFGSTILGIFTDEPSFTYGTSVNEDEKAAGVRKYAYSKGLDKEYREKTGRELFADMLSGDRRFHSDYFALVGEKFRDGYVSKIRKWCDAHGILMTGHLMDEINTDQSLCASGDAIAALRGFSMPGMDEVFTNTDTANAEWITLGTLQAARRRSKHGAMAELTAFGPCDQPPERILQMIRLAALFGVDKYFLGVAPYDSREGYRKRDWFAPVNYTQPWFGATEKLGEYAGKASELAGKTVIPEICVRFPVLQAASEHGENNKINETLLSLLRSLIKNQYQWQFLDTDEEAPEKTRFTAEYDTPIEEIINAVPRTLTVTLADGTLPDEILVRRYTDGTVCVLDLTDSNDGVRTLYLRDGDGKTPFKLYSRGLFVKDREDSSYSEITRVKPLYKLTAGSKSLLRCVFAGESTVYKFKVAQELKVRVIARKYAYQGVISLDGEPVRAGYPCDALPDGMNTLYGATDEITLPAGEHTVTVSELPFNEVYTPSAFICGDFAVKDGALCEMPRFVYGAEVPDTLGFYCGELTYETELTLPDECTALSLNAQCLYTEIFVNGVSLGKRIEKPYVYTLPTALSRKKINLKITQYTTVGPLF